MVNNSEKRPMQHRHKKQERSIINIREYHTVLYDFENFILNTTDDLSDENTATYLQQTHFTNEQDKELFWEKMTTLCNEHRWETNKKSPARLKFTMDERKKIFALWIRNERKKYDESFIKSMLKGNEEDLEVLASFMNGIKQNDAPYYDKAVSFIYEYFQKAPDEKKEELKNKINQIVEGIAIEKIDAQEKDWPERHVDRILFNGGISLIPEDKNKPSIEITPETAAKMVQGEPSFVTLAKLKEKFSDPNIPGYHNAQNLLTVLTYVMETSEPEEVCFFPLLINKTYKKMLGLVNDPKPIFFTKRMRDKEDKLVYDENDNVLFFTNPAWLGSEVSGRKDTRMELGFKHEFRQKNISNPAYKKELCEMVRKYFLDVCEYNGLNGMVVNAVFDSFKSNFDTSTPEGEKDYYSKLYKFLFIKPVKEMVEEKEDGKNKPKSKSRYEFEDEGDNKQNIIENRTLVESEIHHNKDRIYLSERPNTEENYIEVLKSDFGIVYPKLLRTLEALAVINPDITDTIDITKQKNIFNAIRHTFSAFDFHASVLHGANKLVLDSSTSQYAFYYAIPQIKEEKPYAMLGTSYHMSIPRQEKGPSSKKPIIPYDRGRD